MPVHTSIPIHIEPALGITHTRTQTCLLHVYAVNECGHKLNTHSLHTGVDRSALSAGTPLTWNRDEGMEG